MTTIPRTLADMQGYDFTRAEGLSAVIRWTDHRGAVVAEPYEHVLTLDLEEGLDVNERIEFAGRLLWLAESIDPSIVRERRDRAEELETRERKIRMLGHELDSARRGRDEAETREHRAMVRADGLALAVDLLARRVGDSEHEHDETIAELRRTEAELEEARARVAELEAATVVTAEIVDDEEPF